MDLQDRPASARKEEPMARKDADKKRFQGEDNPAVRGKDAPVEISQQDFLEALNVDLAHEYSAVITYRTYASQVQGQ